ncbi:MAG: hypothetical protein LBU76_01115 [Azoarcus sp.]|jgi:hypothetical protein|nr:hypothetical protein [Azoarcus sp.]
MNRWPANYEWSAASLMAGYQRCIVGFDYRGWQDQEKLPILFFDQYRIWMQDRGIFPATVDDQIWQCKTTENSQLEDGKNGFNLYQEWPYREMNRNSLQKENEFYLFKKLFEKINNEQSPKNSILVAFDFPVTLVNTIADSFGIYPLSVDLIISDKNWNFLGYDVADIRLLCSGFYGFDWTEIEFDDICSKQCLNLNSRGLIDDELLAIKSSISFDILVREHAPFAPCGVWVCTSNPHRSE